VTATVAITPKLRPDTTTTTDRSVAPVHHEHHDRPILATRRTLLDGWWPLRAGMLG
jgi:hypothetical protein